MKTITTNKRTLLFVEVPEDWTREDYILHWKNEHYAKPNHDYRFISTTDNAPTDLGITDTLLVEHGITGRHAIIEEL